MVGAADPVAAGREAFAARAWARAHRELRAADAESALGADDLVRLAMAAYLVGDDRESIDVFTRAHQRYLDSGDVAGAVRCAFWIGSELVNSGDHAQASGWFARVQRLVEDEPEDSVAHGFMLVPTALQSLFMDGDAATAAPLFEQAATTADACNDQDLRVLARLGHGQALLRLGRGTEGMALLDEAMVAVTTGDVAPMVAGVAYCAVIAACTEIFDVRRAQEWTDALRHWCAAQPELVPYRGQCLVHRADLMRLHGEWPGAIAEAERARDRLARASGSIAVGSAFTVLGDVHRLRGELAAAEDCYRQAGRWGPPPQPGLALLRYAQRQTATAASSIRRAVDEERGTGPRCKLLPAYVEIMLAAGDVPAARAAASELAALADTFGAPVLGAVADHANGAVLLAEGDPRSACEALRRAQTAWQQLGVPYDGARTRVLLALASRALGDLDTAEFELDAARWAFDQLGARLDLERLEDVWSAGRAAPAMGLTGREVEVLGLVASGRTNRDIAAKLVISEKTVARHVSNIFTKLDVTSRAAATAYAYQHGLV